MCYSIKWLSHYKSRGYYAQCVTFLNNCTKLQIPHIQKNHWYKSFFIYCKSIPDYCLTNLLPTCNLKSDKSSCAAMFVSGSTDVLPRVHLHQISNGQGGAGICVGSWGEGLAIGPRPDDVEWPWPADVTGKNDRVSHRLFYSDRTDFHNRF